MEGFFRFVFDLSLIILINRYLAKQRQNLTEISLRYVRFKNLMRRISIYLFIYFYKRNEKASLARLTLQTIKFY